MPDPVSYPFTAARLTLNYWEWGDRDAPLLLLVHGGRDHGRSWDDVAAAFSDRWRVVAPDLRGHGLSGWADGGAYQMHDFVYDLARLAERLGVSAERPATVLAHSLGGAIATMWTALHPDRVRRLVSIEGLGPSPTMEAERVAEGLPTRLRGFIDARARREQRGLPVYPDLDAAVARMQAAHPNLAPALARHLTEHGVRAVPGGVSFSYDPLMMAQSPFDVRAADRETLWAAITCPTLLVYGGKSWASNPAEDGRARHFRDARVLLFPEAGHWVHHDEREGVVAAIREFIG